MCVGHQVILAKLPQQLDMLSTYVLLQLYLLIGRLDAISFTLIDRKCLTILGNIQVTESVTIFFYLKL